MKIKKTDNQEAKTTAPETAHEIIERIDPDLRGIAAEFPEFAEIIAGANYDSDGPEVFDPDPKMRYFLAANDGDNSRPDGVTRVTQLGYRVSEKKHTSPDCVLMETPRPLYEKRMEKQRRQMKSKAKALRRHVESGENLSQSQAGLEVMDSVRGPRGDRPGFQKLHGE